MIFLNESCYCDTVFTYRGNTYNLSLLCYHLVNFINLSKISKVYLAFLQLTNQRVSLVNVIIRIFVTRKVALTLYYYFFVLSFNLRSVIGEMSFRSSVVAPAWQEGHSKQPGGKNLTKNKNKILKKKMIATQKLFSFGEKILISTF